MPTYKIDDKDYNANDLQRDIGLSIGIDLEKLRILEDARRKGLLSANTFQRTQEKIRFLKQHYGWGNLNGNSTGIEHCKPEQIHAVVTKELKKLLESNLGQLEITVLEVNSARQRIAEYSRLDAEALNREKEAAAKALEEFKAEYPEKYNANVMAALRA